MSSQAGSTVISCDPIYRFEAADIRQRVAATRDHILEQARLNAGDYVWDSIRSIDDLDQLRMTAMNAFLDDVDALRERTERLAARVQRLGDGKP